jgi:hypothetical protein
MRRRGQVHKGERLRQWSLPEPYMHSGKLA